MKYDYSASCDCGKEFADTSLTQIKKDARTHLLECRAGHIAPTVFFDRHFIGGDIDDSFPTSKMWRDKLKAKTVHFAQVPRFN